MTVRELIEELQRHDPDLEVYAHDGGERDLAVQDVMRAFCEGRRYIALNVNPDDFK